MTDDAPDLVMVDGGPLDGQELTIAVEVQDISIGMADGTRHRYVMVPGQAEGRRVMRWAGRV